MNRKLLTTAIVTLTAMTSTLPIAAGADFGDDLAFLKKYTDVIVLSDKAGAAKVALVPAWQGRVMTSTAEGDRGQSFGWINRELIASGKLQKHMNAFGGEDRFWMGPEGGQFSIFFEKGKQFVFDDWFTPAIFDTEPFKVISKAEDRAVFGEEFSLTNYSGTVFQVGVRREVVLLSPDEAWEKLGVKPARDVKLVAYASNNQITNKGKEAWKKETGLLSVWILGMFNPSPSTTIIVPIRKGSESELGKKVTSDYFGEVPADRLVVRDDVVFLKADGQFRSKIGINPKRSKAILGSYDADNKVLTIAQFNQPEGVTDYVNSLWKLQDDPYAGDASNAYNDGPPAPGAKPMGPFYELESSSPAAALAPGESLTHVHRTIHLTGPEAELDAIARATLGVSLADVKTVFNK
ncbi:MAG TPA: hypothetical protein PK458_20205 [Phycisphaerae bacterium]|nr:hypothetical protein [Phycisphaerae bacterium]HOJ76277.1 hypothetical protein [Phycisphaerae bacterium]HOM53661.1 hypothetical protein [Phycisphaerae bacterium]HON67545.1 hypothetical protein [Phycisphaerae bacterium]HPP29020.1 hypothetical protein [Phycisphaerae bacterium]